MARQGDIYITKLERGFFGAIRILKHDVLIGFLNGQMAYLVQICNYIDQKQPLISNPHLLEPLVEERFHRQRKNCIAYFSGSLKRENLIYLDNIPLTAAENNIVFALEHNPKADFDYRGVFNDRLGWEAFVEWRWKNEKLELLNEQIIHRQQTLSQVQEREKRKEETMSDDTFWKMLLLLDWSKKEDQGIIEPLIRYLAGRSVYEIRNFADILSEKLYLLDTKAHAESLGKDAYNDKSKVFSVDNFLARRCLVVSRGKNWHEEISKDPSRMPQDNEFIALLDVAPQAYLRKTGNPFIYQTTHNIETFSNREGWDIILPEDLTDQELK